jgi:hypothetical protein
MAGLSAAGEANVLNSITAPPSTGGSFISLHTGDPGNTGATEISSGGYIRQGGSFANSGQNPTIASNNTIVAFPAATAAWGTVAYFGVWDAPTLGSFLGSGALDAPQPVNPGDQVRFIVGALQISAD